MARKIVHVVGTGTIGEPLIGLLCDFKDELGIAIDSFILYSVIVNYLFCI